MNSSSTLVKVIIVVWAVFMIAGIAVLAAERPNEREATLAAEEEPATLASPLPLTFGRALKVDFGVSQDYARARSFLVSVSRRPALTPDQWQAAR